MRGPASAGLTAFREQFAIKLFVAPANGHYHRLTALLVISSSNLITDTGL